jgi:hypothetical protein
MRRIEVGVSVERGQIIRHAFKRCFLRTECDLYLNTTQPKMDHVLHLE